MITGEKEYLDGIVKTHQCPEHGPKLVVAWHEGEDSYVLRCGEGHFPEEVTRVKTRTQEYKTGELEPVGEGLNLVPTTDLATGALLRPEQILGLTIYARKYHLDIHRSHVVLMYGKPYITIDGYLFHANGEDIPYNLESRPLSETELTAYQVPEGSHAWLAKVSKGNQGGTFTGLGIVTQEEMTATSKKDKTKLASPVVAAYPWQLAQKRAEWQALRRGFPIGESEEKKEE